jgi:hypothetical protein
MSWQVIIIIIIIIFSLFHFYMSSVLLCRSKIESFAWMCLDLGGVWKEIIVKNYGPRHMYTLNTHTHTHTHTHTLSTPNVHIVTSKFIMTEMQFFPLYSFNRYEIFWIFFFVRYITHFTGDGRIWKEEIALNRLKNVAQNLWLTTLYQSGTRTLLLSSSHFHISPLFSWFHHSFLFYEKTNLFTVCYSLFEWY